MNLKVCYTERNATRHFHFSNVTHTRKWSSTLLCEGEFNTEKVHITRKLAFSLSLVTFTLIVSLFFYVIFRLLPVERKLRVYS